MDRPIFFDTWSGLGRILLTLILVYPALIVMLRISGKRTLSKFNAFDFIVTIALGSMLSSIILNGSVPLAEGLLALGLLIGMQFAITWLTVRSQGFRDLIKSEPRVLVHLGVLQDKAMRAERVSKEEILAALHANGRSELSSDCSVIMETDGSLTVFAPA